MSRRSGNTSWQSGAASLGIVALASAVLSGCGPHSAIKVVAAPTPPATSQMPARVKSSGVTIHWGEHLPGGRMRPVLDMVAENANMEQETQSGTLHRTNGVLYRDGVRRARFWAPVVDASDDQKVVVAHNGVVSHSIEPPGITMTADTVTWYPDRNLVIARGHVYMERRHEPGGKLIARGRAERASFDTSLQTFDIPGPDVPIPEGLLMRTSGIRGIAAVSSAGAVLAPAVMTMPAGSQVASKPSTHRAIAHRAHQGNGQKPAAEDKTFAYGDVVISNYSRLHGTFANQVKADGPDVTVTSTDPSTGAVTRLVAKNITATMGKNQAVERVDAEGPIKYDGKRPAANGKGMLTFNGTGTSGTWYKLVGRVEMAGPVAYYAEQPNASGTGKEWAKGTAQHVTYDQNKQLVVQVGEVHVTVYDPENMKSPSPIQSDRVTIDMSGPAMSFDLQNDSPNNGRVEVHPNPPTPATPPGTPKKRP